MTTDSRHYPGPNVPGATAYHGPNAAGTPPTTGPNAAGAESAPLECLTETEVQQAVQRMGNHPSSHLGILNFDPKLEVEADLETQIGENAVESRGGIVYFTHELV